MIDDREPPNDRPLNGKEKFLEQISTPLADRAIAIIACLPYIGVVVVSLRLGTFTIPRATLVAQMLLQIATMFVRRRPQRVTPNPWYWLLAFVATYWSFLSSGLTKPGPALLGPAVTDSLSLLALVMAAWARLSLGRNIGFVPAQRQLVMRGAYRYMRHPIYTSVFLSYLAFVLSAWSPQTALLCAVGCLWFMLKSVIEERFLAGDQAYGEYMRRVRWRWIPGIA